jgi:hypothetical protein
MCCECSANPSQRLLTLLGPGNVSRDRSRGEVEFTSVALNKWLIWRRGRIGIAAIPPPIIGDGVYVPRDEVDRAVAEAALEAA